MSESITKGAAPRVLGVIPARRGSTRLVDKPLQLVAGVPLIQRVYAQAVQCPLITRLVVATDDLEIARVASAAGAEVVMTSQECENGSARVAEACRNVSGPNDAWDAVVNIQGDMPHISPAVISTTIRFFLEAAQGGGAEMATVGTPIFDQSQFLSSSVVKVVIGANDRALYFSRAPMPHSRDGHRLSWQGQPIHGYRHIGLYVFSEAALRGYESLESSALEKVEMLEQLRMLEAGYRIDVCIVGPEMCQGMIEVDTPDDLARASDMAGRT